MDNETLTISPAEQFKQKALANRRARFSNSVNNSTNTPPTTVQLEQEPAAFTFPQTVRQSPSKKLLNTIDVSGLINRGDIESPITRAYLNNLQASNQDAFVRAITNDPFQKKIQDVAEDPALLQANQRLADIQNKIESRQLSNRRELESIQRAEGLQTKSQRNLAISDVERQQASEMADLAIVESAALRNQAAVQNFVDQKVSILTEERDRAFQTNLLFYEENKDRLTREEQRLFESELAAQKFENDQERDRISRLENQKALLISNGATSPQLVSQIQQAESMEQLFAVPGVSRYQQSAIDRERLTTQQLANRLTRKEIELTQAEIDTLGQEVQSQDLNFIANQFGVSSPEFVGTAVLGSAKYGGNRLSDGEEEAIGQSLRALGSVETLLGFLSEKTSRKQDSKETRTAIKSLTQGTGPLSGRAATLITQLGGEADARAINATIQGLIPTVARGIFGEVGVLTDADIKNYREVVPNLTSTEDQNKLVGTVLLDVINRSVGNQLAVAAANQTNVSGFYPIYNNVTSRVEKAKASLLDVTGQEIDTYDRIIKDTFIGPIR